MIRVNQLVDRPVVSHPVVEAAVAIQRLLRRTGPSEIFAADVDPTDSSGIRSLRDYVTSPRDAEDDVLLVHIDVHDRQLVDWLMRRPEKVIAVCHRAPSRGGPASACHALQTTPAGADLRLLRHRADAALAFSSADTTDLARLGFPKVVKTTLPIDPSALTRTAPDELATVGIEGPLLLAAGPIAPERCVDYLLLAYHVFVTYDYPGINLVLAGPPGPPGFVEAMQRMITDLELTRALLVVGATDAQLAAYHRRSNAFASASDGEGFGLELRRALAFGMPVVARRCPGVEEVLEGAGILVDRSEPTTVFAAALATLFDQDDVWEDQAVRSRLAYDGMALEDRERAFLHSLLAVL